MRSHGMARLGVGLMLALVILIGTAGATGDGVRAQAAIDISGDWTIEVEGPVTTTCTAVFDQSPEGELSGDLDCAGLGPGSFSGTIDAASGEFTLDGVILVSVSLEGTASADGMMISGTWSGLGLSGSFSGTRGIEAPDLPDPGIDLGGDWNATFDGYLSGTCRSAMQQSRAELFVAVDCTGIGSGTLRGHVERDTRRVVLDGELLLPARLEGIASADGESVEGTWVVGAVFGGTFTAERKDRTPSFIDATGSWNVTLTPRPGDDLLTGVSDSCTAMLTQSADELSGSVECAKIGSSAVTGTFNPLTGRFRVMGPAEDGIGYFEGSTDGGTLEGLWVDVGESRVSLLAGERTSGPAGDVNCSASVNSVDGALLLQYDAGLIDAVACPEFADANGDGMINSVDASIVLQREAGYLALLL